MQTDNVEQLIDWINYLKATGLKVGLLVNFGKSRLEWKRMVF
ncbi:MAG: GxxExxY protein [Nitrospirota bacterium]